MDIPGEDRREVEAQLFSPSYASQFSTTPAVEEYYIVTSVDKTELIRYSPSSEVF